MTIRNGFTLVEMMIVVAILGILSMIAAPSLVGYITTAKLAEAQTNLMALSLQAERYYQDNDQYPPATADTAATASALPGWQPGQGLRFNYLMTPLSNGLRLQADGLPAAGLGGWRLTLDTDGSRQITNPQGQVSAW